jgi:hypothetical protein
MLDIYRRRRRKKNNSNFHKKKKTKNNSLEISSSHENKINCKGCRLHVTKKKRRKKEKLQFSPDRSFNNHVNIW